MNKNQDPAHPSDGSIAPNGKPKIPLSPHNCNTDRAPHTDHRTPPPPLLLFRRRAPRLPSDLPHPLQPHSRRADLRRAQHLQGVKHEVRKLGAQEEEEKEARCGKAALLSGRDGKTDKLSGREGPERAARFRPPSRVRSPRREALPGGGGRLGRSLGRNPQQPARHARWLSARPGGRPTWGAPGATGASSPAAGAPRAAGRVLPRAPTPTQLEAGGRAGAGLRVGARGRRRRAGRKEGAARRPGRGAASGRTMWRRWRLMGARHHGGAQ